MPDVKNETKWFLDYLSECYTDPPSEDFDKNDILKMWGNLLLLLGIAIAQSDFINFNKGEIKMLVGRISNSTRVLGKSQGYKGLPIRDMVCEDGHKFMQSVWFPTPDEIERIKEGAPIYLSVLGSEHPPVSLTVGEVLTYWKPETTL